MLTQENNKKGRFVGQPPIPEHVECPTPAKMAKLEGPFQDLSHHSTSLLGDTGNSASGPVELDDDEEKERGQNASDGDCNDMDQDNMCDDAAQVPELPVNHDESELCQDEPEDTGISYDDSNHVAHKPVAIVDNTVQNPVLPVNPDLSALCSVKFINSAIGHLEPIINDQPNHGSKNSPNNDEDVKEYGDLYLVLVNYLNNSECLEKFTNFLKSSIGRYLNSMERLMAEANGTDPPDPDDTSVDIDDPDAFYDLLGLALLNRPKPRNNIPTNSNDGISVEQNISQQNGQDETNQTELTQLEMHQNDLPKETENKVTSMTTVPVSNQEEMAQTTDNHSNVMLSQDHQEPHASSFGKFESSSQTSEPKQYCIYKRLESVTETCFAKMSLINDNEKKQAREVGKLEFDAVMDDDEILNGSASGRMKTKNVNGGPNLHFKKFCDLKTCTMERFLAWIRSKPEKRTIEDFKKFEAILKKQNITGLEINGLKEHFEDRVMVKHASKRRSELESKIQRSSSQNQENKQN